MPDTSLAHTPDPLLVRNAQLGSFAVSLVLSETESEKNFAAALLKSTGASSIQGVLVEALASREAFTKLQKTLAALKLGENPGIAENAKLLSECTQKQLETNIRHALLEGGFYAEATLKEWPESITPLLELLNSQNSFERLTIMNLDTETDLVALRLREALSDPSEEIRDQALSGMSIVSLQAMGGSGSGKYESATYRHFVAAIALNEVSEDKLGRAVSSAALRLAKQELSQELRHGDYSKELWSEAVMRRSEIITNRFKDLLTSALKYLQLLEKTQQEDKKILRAFLKYDPLEKRLQEFLNTDRLNVDSLTAAVVNGDGETSSYFHRRLTEIAYREKQPITIRHRAEERLVLLSEANARWIVSDPANAIPAFLDEVTGISGVRGEASLQTFTDAILVRSKVGDRTPQVMLRGALQNPLYSRGALKAMITLIEGEDSYFEALRSSILLGEVEPDAVQKAAVEVLGEKVGAALFTNLSDTIAETDYPEPVAQLLLKRPQNPVALFESSWEAKINQSMREVEELGALRYPHLKAKIQNLVENHPLENLVSRLDHLVAAGPIIRYLNKKETVTSEGRAYDPKKKLEGIKQFICDLLVMNEVIQRAPVKQQHLLKENVLFIAVLKKHILQKALPDLEAPQAELHKLSRYERDSYRSALSMLQTTLRKLKDGYTLETEKTRRELYQRLIKDSLSKNPGSVLVKLLTFCPQLKYFVIQGTLSKLKQFPDFEGEYYIASLIRLQDRDEHKAFLFGERSLIRWEDDLICETFSGTKHIPTRRAIFDMCLRRDISRKNKLMGTLYLCDPILSPSRPSNIYSYAKSRPIHESITLEDILESLVSLDPDPEMRIKALRMLSLSFPTNVIFKLASRALICDQDVRVIEKAYETLRTATDPPSPRSPTEDFVPRPTPIGFDDIILKLRQELKDSPLAQTHFEVRQHMLDQLSIEYGQNINDWEEVCERLADENTSISDYDRDCLWVIACRRLEELTANVPFTPHTITNPAPHSKLFLKHEKYLLPCMPGTKPSLYPAQRWEQSVKLAGVSFSDEAQGYLDSVLEGVPQVQDFIGHVLEIRKRVQRSSAKQVDKKPGASRFVRPKHD